MCTQAIQDVDEFLSSWEEIFDKFSVTSVAH